MCSPKLHPPPDPYSVSGPYPCSDVTLQPCNHHSIPPASVKPGQTQSNLVKPKNVTDRPGRVCRRSATVPRSQQRPPLRTLTNWPALSPLRSLLRPGTVPGPFALRDLNLTL